MPRDKGWSVRPVFQWLAGACLLLALMLDPGCHTENSVELVQATPIKQSRAVSADPTPGTESRDTLSMSAMQVANNDPVEPVDDPSVSTSIVNTAAADAMGFESVLESDPLEALRRLHSEFAAAGRSYRCVFTRQEMLSSGMGPEQDISVIFRPEPFSVAMEFIKNPGLVKRALFVKGRWRDEDAEEELKDQVFVQPAGMAGLLVKSLKQPIRGAMAKRTGRRAIDQFGFERAMHLIIEFCEKAKDAGALKLTYEGEAEFKGRRVWVIRRELPYTGPDSGYPDLIAHFYIDQEHRIPIAIHTFSDPQCRVEDLLGKYEYRDVNFDADVSDADFEPATYGL